MGPSLHCDPVVFFHDDDDDHDHDHNHDHNQGDNDHDDNDDQLYPTGEYVHSDHDGLPNILGPSLHCDLVVFFHDDDDDDDHDHDHNHDHNHESW